MPKTLQATWLAVALFLTAPVYAQTTWTGLAGTSWSTPGSWTAGVPTSVVDAMIPDGAPAYPVIAGTQSCRNLTVATNAEIFLPAGQVLAVHGDLSLQGRIRQTGTVRLSGAGAVTMALGRDFPSIEVASTGLYTMDSLYILGSFTLTSGIARFIGAGSNILGQANFLGGEFQGEPGTISPVVCAQNVTFSGCTVTTNPGLRVLGNWSSDALFQPAGGAVAIDGAGTKTVSAAASTFHVFGVLAPTTLDAVGGPVSFKGGYICFGTTTPTTVIRAAGANPIVVDQLGEALPNLIVDCTGTCRIEGVNEISGFLSLVQGTLLLPNPSELTVQGAATFSGGTLAAEFSFAALLFLNGPAVFNGSTVGASPPVVLAQNSFAADSNYQPADVFTVFYQPGTQTVTLSGAVMNIVAVAPITTIDLGGGTMNVQGVIQLAGSFTPSSTVRFVGTNQDIAGTGPAFPNGEVAGSANLLTSTVFNGTFQVLPGGSLAVGTSSLGVNGASCQINGSCTVGAGGSMTFGSSTSVSVGASGTLNLHGAAANRALLTHSGVPGYSFTCDGTLSAQHARFAGMGSGGITLGSTAQIAAAPFDVRAVSFEAGVGGAGSTLLRVQRTANTSLHYTEFPVAGAASNVSASGPGTVNLVNWTGPFSGPAFENDPMGIITWSPPSVTTLSSFQAVAGREQVSVSWTSTTEIDAVQYILERGPSAGGPFTVLHQPTATGPGTYPYLDSPLVGNQTYHYRLSQVLSHGPVVVLGTVSACPWANVLPANVLAVGGGGAFANIQAALATVTGPTPVHILVAGGTYPSFTITDVPGVDIGIYIAPDGSGPVFIDTTSGPLTILGPNNYFDRIRISGLTIGSALSPHPGVLIQNSDPSVIVLDSLSVIGGAGQPAIVIDNSTHIAIQDVSAQGSPDMSVLGASVVTVARGAMPLIDMPGPGAFLRTCGLASTVNAGATSTHTHYAGVMPGISVPATAQLGSVVAATLTGRVGSTWHLAVAPAIDWYDDINNGLRMVGLLLISNPNQIVAQGVFTVAGGGTEVIPLPTPADKSLLGTPLCLQFLDAEPPPVPPALPDLRWSTQDTIVLLP